MATVNKVCRTQTACAATTSDSVFRRDGLYVVSTKNRKTIAKVQHLEARSADTHAYAGLSVEYLAGTRRIRQGQEVHATHAAPEPGRGIPLRERRQRKPKRLSPEEDWDLRSHLRFFVWNASVSRPLILSSVEASAYCHAVPRCARHTVL